VLLLRNKDQEYNNPLASFATCLCWQRSEGRTCVKRVRGLAVTTLPWWASRSFVRPCLHTLLYTSRSQVSTWSTYYVQGLF